MPILVVVLAALLAACGNPALQPTHALAGHEIDMDARPVLSMQWNYAVSTVGEDDVKPQEFSSPAATQSGSRLYVGSHRGVFYAFDANDGRILWKVKIGSVSSRPVVDEGRVFVGTDDGHMICLDGLDGREVWRYTSKGAILESPVVVDDSIFFSNEDDHVFALDRKTGKFRWQYKGDSDEDYTMRGHGGVAVADDLVFGGFSNGNLVALRSATGTVAWITSLTGGREGSLDVDATPVISGDQVFAASSAGGVFGLDASTGRIRWNLPVRGVGHLETDGQFLFFVGAEEGAYASDLSGHVIWRQGTRGGGEPAKPVLSGNYVLYSLSEAGMFIADKRTGAVRQYFNPGFGISAAPTVIGDSLYVVSNGGVLYSMHVRRF